MEIVVCPLIHASSLAVERRVSHAISLLDPHDRFPSMPQLGDQHLKLGMHDIAEMLDGMTHPESRHVETLLKFAEGWDRKAPMLIHCWAGISRSTASAFTIACAANPQASETSIAGALRRASSTATPNPRIVALADALLAREGRMSRAVAAIGRGAIAERATPFSIPAFYPHAGA